jgi:alkylation response protein AidB-like acyl-CoA dehydrogenase
MTITDNRFRNSSGPYLRHTSWQETFTSDNFTIFEGTSEIQRMIIGRAVTGLDVR